MTNAAILTLIRASKSRSGGPWDADDYDVYDGEWHIGRIMRARSHTTPRSARTHERRDRNTPAFLTSAFILRHHHQRR